MPFLDSKRIDPVERDLSTRKFDVLTDESESKCGMGNRGRNYVQEWFVSPPHLAYENAVVANGAKPLCTAIHIGGLPLQVGPVARRRSLFHLIREVFKELILALGRRNCEDVI